MGRIVLVAVLGLSLSACLMHRDYDQALDTSLTVAKEDLLITGAEDRTMLEQQTFLIEGANVRHEHEYIVWDEVKLPEGKILAPGVVSHATTLIEHPQLVAERISRYADRLGKENVIASTDCGLGLRCHPQIAWAKLKALSEGAKLASEKLW